VQCQVSLSSGLAHEKQPIVLIKAVQLRGIMDLLETAGTRIFIKKSQARMFRFATFEMDVHYRISVTASYTQSIFSKFPVSRAFYFGPIGNVRRDALC
jgi:hypothetical protein